MDWQKYIPKFDMGAIKSFFQKLFNTSIVVFFLGVIVVVLIFWSMCFVYIKPYEFGIKQVNIGIKRGIQPKVYTTGLYFVMPLGLEQMHKFPKDIQVLDLTNNPKQKVGWHEKAAHIQTSDGFFVDVDVSILYRIIDPQKIIHQMGPGNIYIIDGIIPKAEPILKDTLGKLTTEEFYNSPLRVEKMLIAKEKLNDELLPRGLQVEHVLIRYFLYSREIQNSIEDKKLKDQLVFTNQAATKAAAQGAKLAKVIEEGEANYAIEIEKGKAYVVKINASRDLYVRKKHAQADLLVKLAEAEKTRLKNYALQVKGSKNMVGLKMAEVLSGLEVIVLPSDGKNGVNPLDLNKTMGLF